MRANNSGQKPINGRASSATSSSFLAKNQKRASGFKHKKDDDEIDEESGAASKDFMEKKYRRDNDKKLDVLANSVTQIKNLSKNIGNQMEEEK